jgi:O-antigen ligase
LTCAACGLLVARGGLPGVVVLAIAAVAAFAIPFSRLGHRALWVWVVAMPAAYAFLRYPPGKTAVSFDRVWVAATVLAILVTAPRGARRSSASRLMQASLAWLVVSFGLRAALTPSSTVTQVELWIDALCVPFGLFLITRTIVSSAERLRQLMGFLTVAGVVTAAIGIAEFVIGFQLATFSGGQQRFDAANGLVRVSGPFSAPEPFALALVGTLAATLTWVRLRPVPRWLAVSLVVLQAAAIALTLFRAAWLAEAIVLLGGLVAGTTRRTRRLAVLGVGVGILYVSAVNLQQQSAVVSNRINDVANISGRLAAYRQGFAVFKGNPLVGVGVGQYSTAALAAPTVVVGGVAAVSDPHSSFVAVLTEQGIVGFLPLVCASVAVWWLIRALRRRARRDDDFVLARNVGSAAVGYLVMSLTLTMVTYEPSNAIFAVLLGAVAARVDGARRAA